VPSKSAASNPSLATASRLARARGLSITALQAAASAVSRRQALQEALAGSSIAAAAVVFGPAKALAGEGDDSPPLPNGVTYTVSKRGDGPKPDMGELVAIRFAAYAGDLKIDDIFDSPEPYYTRIGSGPLIKGVEDALPFMRLGDRWVLTIPVRMICQSARLWTGGVEPRPSGKLSSLA
jgi:FKBP-type peptidyl-prolyl cis-trans isomerase